MRLTLSRVSQVNKSESNTGSGMTMLLQLDLLFFIVSQKKDLFTGSTRVSFVSYE